MLLVVDLLMILGAVNLLRVLSKFTYVNIRRIARRIVKKRPPLSKSKGHRSKQQFSKLNEKIYLLAALKALKDI
jgi:hypothetical protein